MDPASHVHADRLTRLRLDLPEEVDRVGLKDRHVRVGVERVKAARRVPRGAGGQDRAFDQGDVRPAELGKMVKNRSADDAAPNHDGAIMRFHGSPGKPPVPQGYLNLFEPSRHTCPVTPIRDSWAKCGFSILVAPQRMWVMRSRLHWFVGGRRPASAAGPVGAAGCSGAKDRESGDGFRDVAARRRIPC